MEYCASNDLHDQVHVLVQSAFNYAFDRAYALGKQEKDAKKNVIQGLEAAIQAYIREIKF